MRRFFLAAAFAAGSFAATNGDLRLVDAVKHGQTQTAQLLLSQKADPNVPEGDGTTALMWAVRSEDVSLVEKLLKAGANPKLVNRYDVSAMSLAAINGNATILEALLKAGADVNAPGAEGETPLMAVARTGKIDAAKVLLAHGANLEARESWHGQTALMYAAGEAQPAMVKLLIDAGAKVNDRDTQVKWERQVTAEPREKWLPQGSMTPLLFAARQGCVECIRILADAGAELNAAEPDGITPMISAVINGHYDAAAALLEKGADPNIGDKTGRTPLYAAVDFHTMPQDNRPAPKEIDNKLTSWDLINLLIAKGANVNVQLKTQQPYRAKLDRGDDTVFTTGTTPMIRAAKAGDAPVVKLLIAKGADPKLVTKNGVNALMAAAGIGSREEDNTGRKKTEEETIETIGLLVDAGVDINAVDTRGQSALHGAAFWGKDKVVEFLVAKGAKIDLKDKRGFTPMDSAAGLAGGVGFDQASSVPRPSTAELLKKLAAK